MSDSVSDLQLALFDQMVDTLIEFTDAEPEEEDEFREQLGSAVELLMQGLDMKVVGRNEDGTIAISAALD